MSRSLLVALSLATLAPFALPARAQSSCSSDGQRPPTALLERFINADCAACWADAATPQAQAGELAIDWVLPGGKGEDAPLSAVARRDVSMRLQALNRPAPAGADALRQTRAAKHGALRVAHGLVFNDYVAASIEFKPATPGPWTAWLALVEILPAGTEGSPVERRLVRNLLQVQWPGRSRRLIETRSMQVPEGARPERLGVVGWVQDTNGHMAAIAQSHCAPWPRGG